MDYLYLGEDDEGVSYFDDRRFLLELRDFAPPAPGMYQSDALPAAQTLFLTLPAGWGGTRHPSPHRQIAFCLSGRLKVEAGNGDSREFGAGSIWWMEDVSGEGHTTTVLGDEDVRLAIVQLD